MYKSNDFKKLELLNRSKRERSLLASNPITDEIQEELNKYDDIIESIEMNLLYDDLYSSLKWV